MRKPIALFSVMIFMAALAGCPYFPSERFTSADLSGGYYPTADAGDGAAEGDGANGGAEREVVEPDVIRQDGNLLYVLNQYRGLSIVDLATESLLAQLPTLGYPRDLYLRDGTAYILVGYAQEAVLEDGIMRLDIGSRLYVADVTEPANASIVADFDLEGDLVDSRMVGDALYVVGAAYQWYYGVVDVEPVEGDGESPDDAGVTKKQTGESWVTSVAVGDPGNIAVVDSLSIPGAGNVIQATAEAIFVAAPPWYGPDGDYTQITYIDISDPAGAIVQGGAVSVPGYVADRFKMDAYEGVLRVVSNTGWQNREVYITTVDLSDPSVPAILGQTTLEGAQGETLFATRFDGHRAYIVTYLLVDPLFVVDLSDPANPVVAGELEVPGWSTHIEPRGDLLVTLGVDDADGRKVKVSLFDVADPTAPSEVATASFGDGWSWSTAYTDVKSFTVLDDLLMVPVTGWSEEGAVNRLQFLSYTPTSLTVRGSAAMQGQILRSFRYGGNYYGVTSEQVAVVDGTDLDSPEVTGTITLAEYVFDYLEMGADLGAMVVAHADSQEVVVRTETLAGTPLGEVTVPMANVSAAEKVAGKVVLTASEWDYETYDAQQRVVIVDVSDPSAPAVTADISIDMYPWWGWCYYCYGPEVDMMAKQFADMAYLPYGYGADSALVAGDLLVLRGTADAWDITVGDDMPYSGVAVVDVAAGALLHTIGLGYEQLVSVEAAGDNLYLSTREALSALPAIAPRCAWYVQELDPTTAAVGPAANVPGRYLQYDPATDVLVLQDWQYGPNFETENRLRTVRWTGGETVQVIDQQTLPDYVGNVQAAGSRLYYEHYDTQTQLSAVALSPSGMMSLAGTLVRDGYYGWLLAAQDTQALLSYGNSIARYDFAGEPALEELVQVMGWPNSARFGADTVYVPMGYSGLAKLPL